MAPRLPLDEIEKTLAAAGLKVSDLCREAGIDRSSWTKMRKRDSMPTRLVRQAVLAALRRLTAPRKGGRAVPAQQQLTLEDPPP